MERFEKKVDMGKQNKLRNFNKGCSDIKDTCHILSKALSI